jgi:hypothetical protein
MKFLVPKINTSLKNFLRVCGYKEIYNPHKQGEISYARSLEASRFYPRFHIYAQILQENKIEINLHMDMKRPSYEGSTAHSGEYEGTLIEREGNRIKNVAGKFILETALQHQPIGFKKEKSFLEKVFKFLSF